MPGHSCSHPPTETRPIWSTLPADLTERPAEWPRSATSAVAVVDITIPMMRRTGVLVCAAMLNIARTMLSGRRGASAAVGRALWPLPPAEQHLSSKPVCPAATLRAGLRDRPNA
jgi:hypothetical protein